MNKVKPEEWVTSIGDPAAHRHATFCASMTLNSRLRIDYFKFLGIPSERDFFALQGGHPRKQSRFWPPALTASASGTAHALACDQYRHPITLAIAR